MSLSVLRSKTAAVFFRFAETSLTLRPQYWSFALESIWEGACWVPDKSVRSAKVRSSLDLRDEIHGAREDRDDPAPPLETKRALVVQALGLAPQDLRVGRPDLDAAPQPG